MTAKQQSRVKSSFTCFLSLPHEYSDLRSGIEKLLNEHDQYRIDCKYVTRSEGRQLRDEVIEKLSSCDFIIADVSTGSNHPKGPRPNIMWELGFAWHKDIQRIIVVNQNETENVASLIIDQHYIPYNLNSLDTLFKQLAPAIDAICSRVETERTKMRAESIYNVSAYIDRVEINIPKRIRETSNFVRILETNLESVATDLADHLKEALGDQKRPRLTVQICALNPHSPFAKARAEQLARLEEDYESELIESLDKTYNKLKNCDRKRWELRIYDTFPTQITFSFDNDIFSSIMALGKKSRHMIHFHVLTSNKGAYDAFIAHFNDLWRSAETYQIWRNEIKKHGKKH